jgi:uncharacterized protein YndB with AHSA1/START domain
MRKLSNFKVTQSLKMEYRTNKHFTLTIELAKSPQEVFGSITDGVAKWWGGQDLTGSSTKLMDEFVVHHPGSHYSKQQLVEWIPNKRVVWLVTESHLPWLKDPQEWTNTNMVFDLTDGDGTTLLHFTHEGLTPEKECYDLVSQGWKTAIGDWLFVFITQGKAHF